MSAHKHTPGPWKIRVNGHGETNIEAPTKLGCVYIIASDIGGQVRRDRDRRGRWTDKSEVEANARLIAAAPDLYEAAIVQHECGHPSPVSLYDEEGIEGWRWTHPDGRQWEEIGEWSGPPPMHPMMADAIAKATGGEG